jgi:GntR family transcriptional regulator
MRGGRVPEHLYRRIADDLRLRIESGVLTPGSRLPTEVELRDAYRVSRNTIRDALKWLLTRGLIETRHGQGTFVARKFEPFITTLSADWQTESGPGGGEGQAATAEVTARNRSAHASPPTVGIQQAAGNIAARLRVPDGTSVVSRHQRHYIDGTPWSLQTTYYPMRLVDLGARRLLDATDIHEGVLSYLEKTLHIKQVGHRDRILVRPPKENEVRFFRLPEDGRTPVAVLLRTGFTVGPDSPVPYRLTETLFPADRTQFVINEGEVPDRLAVAAEV